MGNAQHEKPKKLPARGGYLPANTSEGGDWSDDQPAGGDGYLDCAACTSRYQHILSTQFGDQTRRVFHLDVLSVVLPDFGIPTNVGIHVLPADARY